MSNREVIERAFRQWRYESLREGLFPDCYRPHDVVEAVLMAWHLAKDPRRYQRWKAYWQRQKKLRYAGHLPERAPPGGVWIGGKFYPGGQFIPEHVRQAASEGRAEVRFPDNEQTSQTGEMPVVDVSANSLGNASNSIQLRELAWEYWKNNLRGKGFINKHTGKRIWISRRGIQKLLNDASSQPWRSLVVPSLPEIIKHAKLVRSLRANRTDAHYKWYHYFDVRIRVMTRMLDVEMVVGEDQNGNWFYTFSRKK